MIWPTKQMSVLTYIINKCKITKMSSKVKITWLSRRDLDTGIENMLCSGVITVLGRGVVGSLTTASVPNTSAHPISASKNSRNVICKTKPTYWWLILMYKIIHCHASISNMGSFYHKLLLLSCNKTTHIQI